MDDIIRLHLNVTELVRECPDACGVIYGSGNPDISGKGVMISYISQAALTCLFTTLPHLYRWIIKPISWNLAGRLHGIGCNKFAGASKFITILEKLRPSLYESNAFFTVSIFIAALVRYSQTPSIFEVVFIDQLVNLQTFIVLAMLVSRAAELEELQKLGITQVFRRERSVCVYVMIMLVCQLVATYASKLPRSAFPQYYIISLACHSFTGYLDVSSYFTFTNTPIFWELVAFGLATGTCYLLGLCIGIASLGYILRHSVTAATLWERIIPRYFREHFFEMFVQIFILSMFSLCGGLVIWRVIELQGLRSWIVKSSQKALQDNDWGYGQTTAVLIWMPILRRAVIVAWETYRQPSPQATNEGLPSGASTTSSEGLVGASALGADSASEPSSLPDSQLPVANAGPVVTPITPRNSVDITTLPIQLPDSESTVTRNATSSSTLEPDPANFRPLRRAFTH